MARDGEEIESRLHHPRHGEGCDDAGQGGKCHRQGHVRAGQHAEIVRDRRLCGGRDQYQPAGDGRIGVEQHEQRGCYQRQDKQLSRQGECGAQWIVQRTLQIRGCEFEPDDGHDKHDQWREERFDRQRHGEAPGRGRLGLQGHGIGAARRPRPGTDLDPGEQAVTAVWILAHECLDDLDALGLDDEQHAVHALTVVRLGRSTVVQRHAVLRGSAQILTMKIAQCRAHLFVSGFVRTEDDEVHLRGGSLTCALY